MANTILQKLESSIEESIKPDADVPLRVVQTGARGFESEGRVRAKGFYNIDIDRIVADKQIREQFENLDEMSDSIKRRGIDAPVIVYYATARSIYVLIAGERRFRAAKLAGLETLPCKVMPEDISEAEILEIQVTENVQRESLNPVEEAKAYQLLKDKLGCTAKEVARRVGKNETTVTRALRYLKFPKDIQQAIATGKIKKTTARELARVTDGDVLEQLLKRATAGNLSSEEAAQVASKKKKTTKVNTIASKPFPLKFEGDYGLEVIVRRSGDGGDKEKLTYDHISKILENAQSEVQHLIKKRVSLQY